MRPALRACLLLLLGFGMLLYVRLLVGTSAEAIAQSPLQLASQTATATPTLIAAPLVSPQQNLVLVYPLPARFKINALVDHDSPDYNPNATIAVYSGGIVSNDPNNSADDSCSTFGSITVCGYTDLLTPVPANQVDLRWDQDIEGAGTGGPGWLWYDGHDGYDLGCPSGTGVNAAGAGIPYWVNDSTVYIDHGNGYRTYYYHLSGTPVVPELTPVAMGQKLAESGDYHGQAHLHFQVDHNEEAIDPSGWEGNGADPLTADVGNLWVGGYPVDPIPMGYRDQNNQIDPDAPFQLDEDKIRNLWLDSNVARRLGSPVGFSFSFDCEGGTTGYGQYFERGQITYCGDEGAGESVYSHRTYLPNVRARESTASWNSTIYIRNMGPASARVNVAFYSPEGWILESRTYRPYLQTNATWKINVHEVLADFLFREDSNPAFNGTAVVTSDYGVSVVVVNERDGEIAAYTGISDDNVNSGWGEPSDPDTSIYVPTIFWSPNWGADPPQDWYSTVHVQNVGSAPTEVMIYYYNGDGSHCATRGSPNPVPANAGIDFPADACGDNYSGSARVESLDDDQPLAVVVTQEDRYPDGAGHLRASQYNAFSLGATTIYASSVMNAWYNWTSSFTVQNLGAASTSVVVSYRVEEGGVDHSCRVINLPPSGSCMVVQNGDTQNACTVDKGYGDGSCAVEVGWEGSVELQSDQQIVAVVNQEFRPYSDQDRRHQSYSSSYDGGQVLAAPFAAYHYHPDPDPPKRVAPCVSLPAYRSASHIQNLSGFWTTLSTLGGYYDLDGNQWGTGSDPSVAPWRVRTFYLPIGEGLPCGFTGSLRTVFNLTERRSGVHNIAKTIDSQGLESGDFGANYNMPQWTDTRPPSSRVNALSTWQTSVSFSVSWFGTDDLSGLASYDIQYRIDNDAWTGWLTETTTTSTLFTGAHGHIYAFRSRARDVAENLEDWPVDPDASTTVDTATPASQVNTLSAWQTNSSFSVSWSGSDPVSGIAEYDIQVCTIDCELPEDAVWEDWLTHITATSSLFTGGPDGSIYYFRSRARDNAGNLELYPELPDAHTHLDLSAPTSQVSALPTYSPGNFTVSWSGSDSFSGVASYDIQVCAGTCDAPQGAWVDWLTYTTTTSAPFTGDHNTQYHFRSRARDNAGNVEPYPEPGDTSTTVDALPPETSVAALSTYIDQSSFLISWDGSDGPSGLSYYNVYYRDESQSTWTPWLSGVTLTSTTFFGGPGHTYHFCSQGVDNVGNQEDCPSGVGQPWPIQSDAHTSVQPGSRVNDLPPTVAQTTFLVSWSGSPDVSLYDVQVREGLYGVWMNWKTDVNYTQAEYTGQWGTIYYFRSRGKTMLVQEFWPYDYDTFTKPVMPGALGGAGLPAALLLADEAPDHWEEVTVTQALGVPVVGRIGMEGDVDWYRFEITEMARLHVRLDELPADYDLYVFDGEGRFLWSSTWGQTLPDEVTVRAPAGVYYVQLVGYAGAWNAGTPYRLLVELAK